MVMFYSIYIGSIVIQDLMRRFIYMEYQGSTLVPPKCTSYMSGSPELTLVYLFNPNCASKLEKLSCKQSERANGKQTTHKFEMQI